MSTYKKKLIEVNIPLEAINVASAREKSIRHGHPSTLHIWWARRPLAACRAVLFASLVDDPSAHPELFPTEEEQEAERERLFRIMEDLVVWENSNNEEVLSKAREEIKKSTKGSPPPVYDPFAGGGSIPLEAQRLGLEAHASDLNPVAVLINKAMIEIPARFQNRPPVHPGREKELIQQEWKGARGLAEDVQWYGKWMRDRAFEKIGHLYPEVDGHTVIAWLWARTVTCPNPACGAEMPLVRSFWLSKKKGKESWIEPQIDKSTHPATVRFEVKSGKGEPEEGTVNRNGGRCIVCGAPVPFTHIRSEGKKNGLGSTLMAIVAEGSSGRIYIRPLPEHQSIAEKAVPEWKPEGVLPVNPRDFKTPNYGMKTISDLFTPRQLTALTTFSDLIADVREKVLQDARAAGMADDDTGINTGGTGARAYAETVATYLGFIVDKQADLSNSLNRWEPIAQCPRQLFARQAIPMVWDYAEGNPFSSSSGSWLVLLDNFNRFFNANAFNFLRYESGIVNQKNISDKPNLEIKYCVSTDPPYYDNIGYADLSDFFYIWLRKSLKHIYPNIFKTLLVPKSEELVATPYRFDGDKDRAKAFFEEGLLNVFSNLKEINDDNYPITIYYAFKQNEALTKTENGNMISSTGWETMLQSLIDTSLMIIGTWPIRTEMSSRMIGQGTNALASSIVLVCRKREEDAGTVPRRDFMRELQEELPGALRTLQSGNIAPVDLAQSAIGPGMAIFSKYAKVLEADGSAMTVRTALGIINQVLDQVLAEQEGEYDPYTRWAVAWFDQHGMKEGQYGTAEILSKAKDVSVQGVVDAGIISSKGGKVRLLTIKELDPAWDPEKDENRTAWEVLHYMIRDLAKGESASASVLAAAGPQGEVARDLAYRLYSICEKKGWAGDAVGYNSIIASWPEIARLSMSVERKARPGELDFA